MRSSIERCWVACSGCGLRSTISEGEGIGALGEFKGNGGHGGCGAVLDGGGELVAVTAQIEILWASG